MKDLREQHEQSPIPTEVQALMDAIPAVVLIAHDPQARVITGNRAAQELLRMTPRQNISKAAPVGEAPRHFRVFKEGRELMPNELALQRAATGIPVHDFEYDIVFEDGKSNTMFGNAVPLFDAQGKPRGAIATFIDVTEQRAAARESERQKRLFQSLTERLPNIITRVDLDGRYLYVSPALSAMSGRPAEYYIGKTLEEAGWPAETCQTLRSAREQALTTGKPATVEFELVSPKGLGRHHHTVIPEFSPDGTIESLLTVAFDLTPQMQTEQRLKASAAELERQKRMFQSLTEHIPHIVSRLDPNGLVLYVSPLIEKVTGLPPEHFIGKTVTEVGFPPEFSRLIIDKVSECVHTKAQVFVEAKFPAVNGDRDFAHIGVPEFGEDGSVDSVLAVSMDVTPQKDAERALKESANLLQRAQRIANMGSYDYDLVAQKVRLSEQLCAILGVETDTYDMHTGWSHIPEEELPRLKQAFDSVINTGDPYRVEHTVRRQNGELLHVVSQGEVVARNASGKPTRLIGTVADITERRRAEEELNKAQKLESLGLLAGGIAHDFNNLLTAIFGNVFLARLYADERQAENAQIIDALTQAESAFKRARDLAQQLLTFSRGGAPVRNTIALGPLIQEVVTFTTRGSGMRPEFLIDPDLWHVNVDEGQIGQAINNVVINALQAGATLLRVDARNVFMNAAETQALPPGRYIQLRLQDNGCGIPEEHLAKLFDPYFTTKPGGTGLGLPTTYSIVKRHLGNVVVDSSPGHGTRFTIYLPASDEPLSEIGNEQDMIAGRTGRHGRALLMDDEAPVREVGSALLEKLGYEVELARDGEEAVQLFKAAAQSGKSFSVVILDLTVPGGMGGKECLEHLRAIDPGVKALVSSGYFNDPVMAQHEQYGFQGRVPKPYRLVDLSRALEAVEGASLSPAANT